MADYGIQLGKVVFAGLLSVVLTIDAVVGLQALYYWQLDRAETSEDLFQPPPKLEALLAAQRPLLTDYRMVDAKKEIVAIPIGRAMELVVAELSPKGGAAAGDCPNFRANENGTVPFEAGATVPRGNAK